MVTVPAAPLPVSASPLSRALGVLGDWWTLMVLREAFLGVRGFERFRARLADPPVARQTLANRLQTLVADGILALDGREYRLTAKGRDLYVHALLLWRWERRWHGACLAALPRSLVHADCGQRFTPLPVCLHCRGALRLAEVSYRRGPGAGRALPEPHSRRMTGAARLPKSAAGTSVYTVADRWAHLTLGAVFLGERSFAEIAASIGAATNILADRLVILVRAGFLVKRRSAADARRVEYTLTERGRDIFPVTVALAEWAERWLPNPAGRALHRTHACGERLSLGVCCSACNGLLRPGAVRFTWPATEAVA